MSDGSSRSTWLTPERHVLQRRVRQRVGQRPHTGATGLGVGVRARQQHRGAGRDAGRQIQRVDRVGLDDGLDVAGIDDCGQPLGQLGRHGATGARLGDRRRPCGDDPVGLLLVLLPRLDRRGDIGLDPAGDQIEVAAGQRLQQSEGVNSRAPEAVSSASDIA